jgi:hypothetical protein
MQAHLYSKVWSVLKQKLEEAKIDFKLRQQPDGWICLRKA